MNVGRSGAMEEVKDCQSNSMPHSQQESREQQNCIEGEAPDKQTRVQNLPCPLEGNQKNALGLNRCAGDDNLSLTLVSGQSS
jgi:hypothetical protein